MWSVAVSCSARTLHPWNLSWTSTMLDLVGPFLRGHASGTVSQKPCLRGHSSQALRRWPFPMGCVSGAIPQGLCLRGYSSGVVPQWPCETGRRQWTWWDHWGTSSTGSSAEQGQTAGGIRAFPLLLCWNEQWHMMNVLLQFQCRS